MIARLFDWLTGWKARQRARRRSLEEARAAEARRVALLADPDLTPLERLVGWWAEPPASGIAGSDIEALERRYAVTLPDPFRAYLRKAMPEGKEWDAEGTRWWPLDEIKSVREECSEWDGESALDSEKLLVFADYMIWCWAWAIDCSDTDNRGKVAIITGKDHYVADSFDDFLDRYLRDDTDIHR